MPSPVLLKNQWPILQIVQKPNSLGESAMNAKHGFIFQLYFQLLLSATGTHSILSLYAFNIPLKKKKKEKTPFKAFGIQSREVWLLPSSILEFNG